MRTTCLLTGFAVLLAGCGDSPAEPLEPIRALPRPLSAAEVEIVGAANGFAGDILGRVHAATPDSTVFLSPLSLSVALGMTMNGAAGPTRSEMQEMLGFGSLTADEINRSYRDLIALLGTLDERVEIGIANAAFHRQEFPVEPAFVRTLADYFGAHTEALDFSDPSAADAMNAWAQAATRDRIRKVIEPPLDPNLMLVLMNAVYFNGDWTTAFDPADSYDGPFAGIGATEVVRFMTKEDSVGYRASDVWEAVELPYGGGAWTMVVALPLGDHDVGDVIGEMDALVDPAAEWSGTSVALHLPRLELEWERKLNDDLEALGMVSAFYRDRADFSGIHPTAELFVHFVKQNTFLRVDEVGTEAAAVTTVGVGIECVCGPPEFRADRPFVLVIRERLSGTVLFAGAIVEPPVE